MSRVLVLLPSVPWPMDAGARLRNAGLLELLAQDHAVDVVAFGAPVQVEAVQRVAEHATLVPLPPRRSPATRLADMARSELPDMAQRLWSPRLAEVVRRQLRAESYVAVQAEGIEMARYLALAPPWCRVYDAHNAEFLLQARLATRGSVAGQVYSRLQAERLKRFEGEVVGTSALTLTVSNHDANQLIALSGGGGNVHVVPNAIDVGAYEFRLPQPKVAPNLLFLGKLDYRPNDESLAWFIRHVLPGLPEARLFAVGAAPPSWLVDAGQHDSRIAVTGYVADERPYFARCAALVLPARTGAGSRLKALVAMAGGLPIVSTRLGMEGIDAEPGTHFLVADTPEEWVTAVRRVLGDAQLRGQMACNARALVEQRYAWPALRPELKAAYASLGL